MPLSETGIVRANLSYNEIQRYTKWSDNVMINDYLGIGQSTELIAAAVDQNEEDIEENRVAIDLNATNLADHISDNTAHGVTGVVVGTEDFCTNLVGGVVLLMDLVADAIDSTAEITIDDLAVAPAAYDQAYADLQSTLVNDIKAKHNTLLLDLNQAIGQLNELIANSKTAKQMDA